jgi:hypothetical protein
MRRESARHICQNAPCSTGSSLRSCSVGIILRLRFFCTGRRSTVSSSPSSRRLPRFLRGCCRSCTYSSAESSDDSSPSRGMGTLLGSTTSSSVMPISPPPNELSRGRPYLPSTSGASERSESEPKISLSAYALCEKNSQPVWSNGLGMVRLHTGAMIVSLLWRNSYESAVPVPVSGRQ